MVTPLGRSPTPGAIAVPAGERAPRTIRARASSPVAASGLLGAGTQPHPAASAGCTATRRGSRARSRTELRLAPGRHRVALLHLREAGPDPAYELSLVAASAPDGSPAAAEVHLLSVKGEPR